MMMMSASMGWRLITHIPLPLHNYWGCQLHFPSSASPLVPLPPSISLPPCHSSALPPAPVKLPITGGGKPLTKPGTYIPSPLGTNPRKLFLGSRTGVEGGGTRGGERKMMSVGRGRERLRMIVVVELPLGCRSMSERKGKGSLTVLISCVLGNGRGMGAQKCSQMKRSICQALSASV